MAFSLRIKASGERRGKDARPFYLNTTKEKLCHA